VCVAEEDPRQDPTRTRTPSYTGCSLGRFALRMRPMAMAYIRL
jgi:hypothetical protein